MAVNKCHSIYILLQCNNIVCILIKILIHFIFQLIKHENNNTVEIIGSTGVAVAWGFHHYLKYYCNCHISWEADQLNLPIILPSVNISVVANDRFDLSIYVVIYYSIQLYTLLFYYKFISNNVIV